MTITDLLKLDTQNHIQVDCNGVWLYWLARDEEWTVFGDRADCRRTEHYQGTSETDAVAAFCKAAGIEAKR